MILRGQNYSVGGVEGAVTGTESVGGAEGTGPGVGGGEDNDKFSRRPTIIPIRATKIANLKENPEFLLLLRLFNVSCKSEKNRIISSIVVDNKCNVSKIANTDRA